jgi:ribosome-associated translation inhibitor RaiA
MADIDNDTFALEFTSNIAQPDAGLQVEAEDRLGKLAGKHRDIIGAAVVVTELSNDNTPHSYRARVVVYMRPENVVAAKEKDNPGQALKEALSAVERQVREQREKLRERWKQP